MTRLAPPADEVWRLEPKGRRLQVEVQPRGGEMLAGDLSLQIGRRVIAAQPSAAGTFTLAAPRTAADAHDVRLVVTRAAPSAVSYRLRLSDSTVPTGGRTHTAGRRRPAEPTGPTRPTSAMRVSA